MVTAPRLSVLVAEDNPVLQTLMKHLLASWGYDPILRLDGRDAWELLQSDASPRLAVLDWMMPGIDGVELCRRVRAAGREPYTYILLVSSRADSADLVAAMDAGADDYIRKPFDPQEFRVRLNAGRRVVELQQELLAAREALRHRAMRDDATGLLNHAAILEALDTAAVNSVRLAVLLVDIDRLRQINDSFGHPAGDAVLREAARRISAVVPPEAVLGRYRSGEFLVVLPGAYRTAAEEIGGRILDAIRADTFTAGAASFPVTCCLGIASCGPPATPDGRGLLRDAGEALLWSERQGAASAAGEPREPALP